VSNRRIAEQFNEAFSRGDLDAAAGCLLDGEIVEHFANRDDVGMMRQLGLLPPAPVLSRQ
jgi:hypothetical protein